MQTHRALQSLWVVLLVFVVASAAAAQAPEDRQGQIFISVTDQAGAPVPDLEPGSFQVQEDGTDMTILSAMPGTTPMKIAVLVDNSEMMRASNGISSLRNALIEFLNTLPAQHELALYSIAGSPRELVDFTTDRDALRNAADGLFPETGGSRMMDGLRETWERRFDHTEAWPVIFLVLTDGPETSNNMSPDLFNAFVYDLLLNGVMVHAVLLHSQLSSQAGGFQTQIAPILTQNTGGLFRTLNSPTALVDTLAEVATRIGGHFDAMAPRYRVIYERPTNTPGAQIGASVMGNYNVALFGDRKLPDRAAMPRIVTAEAFGRIEEGMTYAQVVEIVGAEGTETGQSTLAGTTTVLYQWANPDSSNMSATFQNGVLIGKTQSRL